MSKPNTITNAIVREIPADKTAETGKPIVIQLAPFGDYPQTIDNDPATDGRSHEVVQKVDEKAVDTLVSNFKDKVLVDADHSSETSTNTRAMAWVSKLWKDPEKGLMAEIEPTSEGAEKINGKVYRFVSAAWTLDDEERPVELVSVGLTNKPNLPVAPMLNNQQPDKAKAGTASPDDGDGSVTPPLPKTENADDEKAWNGENKPIIENPQEGNSDMNIREKLGLPAEATDAEVEQALDALIARCGVVEDVQNALGLDKSCTNEETMEALNAVIKNCGDLQAQNAAMEEATRNAEAEQFIAKNDDVIPDEAVESVKEEYKADPEAAKQTIANFRLVARRAIANAQKSPSVPARTHIAVKNSEAKRPVVLNMADALKAANGDPAKENEIIKQYYSKQ